MKATPIFATLSAVFLFAPPIRGEDEKKPEVSRDPASSETSGKEEGTPKREKPRRPEGAPESPAPAKHPPRRRVEGEGKPAPKAADGEKHTWLGISTHPVDPSLREHLEIPEGFGIQVVEVMPDSPASAAGVRSNDILVRFEDQRLISPEHLSLLVREKAVGDKVSLALIRKGREETIEVTLGEADENLFGPWGAPDGGPRVFPTPPRFGQDPSQWQEQIRKQQDEILRQQKEWMERHRQGMRHPEPGKPEPGVGGRPPGVSVSPGFPLRVFGSEGVLNIDNDQGELTLTRKDGKHHLVIEDAAGKVVYDGPFDPEKGVDGLPEEAREQLEVMKLGNLEIRLPETPGHDPKKTAEPKPSGEEPGEIL